MHVRQFPIHALIVATLSLLPVHIGRAQAEGTRTAPSDSSPTWSIGTAQVNVGVTKLDITELNTVLARSGRPQFGTSRPTLGINAYARFGRVMLGAGGETSLGNRQVAEGWMSRLSVGAATLDAGYVIASTRRTVVYSMASVGVRMTGLQLEELGDFTYEEGVDDPSRGVTLSSVSALAQLGLTLEQHLEVRRLGDVSVAISSGIASPFGQSTIAGESRVNGTPVQRSGTYLRLSMGKPLGKRSDALSAVSAALLSIVGR